MGKVRVIHESRDTLRWMWLRLGDSSALSPFVALLYFPFGLAGPLWIDPERVGGTVTQWLLVGLVGQAALTVVLIVGHRLAYSRDADACHPITNLSVLALAVCARAIAIAWFAQVAGVVVEFEIQYRIGSGIFAQTGALIFIALLVSAYRYHKRLISNLADQQRALDELNGSLKGRLEATNNELRAEIHQSIDPPIAKLFDSLAQVTKSTNVSQIQEFIRHIVDDELRPLSHKIALVADETRALPNSHMDSVNTRIAWPTISALATIIKPLAIGIWVGLLAGSQGLRLYSVPYALSYSVFSGFLVGVMLFVIRLVIGKWKPPTLLSIFVAFGMTVLSVALTYQLEKSIGIEVPEQIGSAGFFAVPLMALITAVYSVIVSQREAIELQLRESIDKRILAQSGLRQREYVARQRLGYLIHGTLQTALNAAALRLAAAPEPDLELIERVRADVAKAVAQLDEPTSPYIQLIDTLNDISSLWENTCDIRWSMDHKTVRILVDAPDAALSVTEIIREGVGNAIRHGRASSIRIRVAGQPDRVIVSVIDNGSGIAIDSEPGLGSRMLDQICIEWDRRSNANETHLVAHIAT